jgi:aspartyl-tRNA(Asn)/glutamyl-tRNA(Gln) amidotransferase subunit A
MLSVIAGPDDRDRHSLPGAEFDWMESLRGGVRGLRVAYSPDWGYATIDPRVREIVGKAVTVFERDLGCVVEEAHPGWSDPEPTFWALVAMETDLRGMRAMADRLGDRMSPHLREFLRTPFSAEDLTDAVVARKALCNTMWKFMRRYDLLLTPTLGVPAFPLGIQGPDVIDGRTVSPYHWLAFTFQMNMTGQPAASVPAGFTADGLPVGLQIVGRHLDDPAVLRAAAAFEAAAPWRHRWPPIADGR